MVVEVVLSMVLTSVFRCGISAVVTLTLALGVDEMDDARARRRSESVGTCSRSACAWPQDQQEKKWGKNKICRKKKDPTAERQKFPFFFLRFSTKLVTWYLVHYSVNIESSKLDIKNDTTLFEIIKTVCVLII